MSNAWQGSEYACTFVERHEQSWKYVAESNIMKQILCQISFLKNRSYIFYMFENNTDLQCQNIL